MKTLTLIFLTAALLIGANALADETTSTPVSFNAYDAGMACTGSYYNWGKAQNGWGYCYEYTCAGDVLNQGQPVSNYMCESVRPSYYNWGRAQNGWGYCYQYTPYGVTMNKGMPVSNYSCEASRPSHYAWGRGGDGMTRCYQYTPDGVALNKGQPVSDYLCK